jgi:predicted RNase H-like HicB family nuclease
MRSIVIVIEHAGDNYSAYAPELPGCVATGATEANAETNMRKAVELHLKGMAEDGLLADEARDTIVRRIRVATG